MENVNAKSDDDTGPLSSDRTQPLVFDVVTEKTALEELKAVREQMTRLASHTERAANIAEATAQALSTSLASFSQVEVQIKGAFDALEAMRKEVLAALDGTKKEVIAEVALLRGELAVVTGQVGELHEDVFDATGRAGRAEQTAIGVKVIATAARAEAKVAEAVAKAAEKEVTRVDEKLSELKEHVVNPQAAEHERRRSHQEDELREEVRKHREMERAMLLAKEEEDRKERERKLEAELKAKEHEQLLARVAADARREERRAIWSIVSKVAAGVFSAGFLAAVVALASHC